MITKVVSVIIITLFLNIDVFTQSYVVAEMNTVDKVATPNEITRINNLMEDNSGTVSEESKKELKRLNDKLDRFEALTQEEIEYIRQCELGVIKAKLGEAQFQEYCKLIEKREGNGEFLPPERFRLYEIEKQLGNIK